MMKFLLLLAVLGVAYLLWRNARLQRRDREASARPGRRAVAAPQDMVSCPVCAVHLPRSEALPGPDGELYCSKEHRLRGRS